MHGAKNRGGIGLSYRPARLHRLAEFIPWNWFLGSINVIFWVHSRGLQRDVVYLCPHEQLGRHSWTGRLGHHRGLADSSPRNRGGGDGGSCSSVDQALVAVTLTPCILQGVLIIDRLKHCHLRSYIVSSVDGLRAAAASSWLIAGNHRDGIFKLLRSLGIDSKESILPTYLAWWSGIRQRYSFIGS